MTEPDELLAMLDAGKFRASPSSANTWLVRNRDALIARFKGQRVDWKAFAAAMASTGLRDANGNPPKPATLQRAWARIKGPARTTSAPASAPPDDDADPAPATPSAPSADRSLHGASAEAATCRNTGRRPELHIAAAARSHVAKDNPPRRWTYPAGQSCGSSRAQGARARPCCCARGRARRQPGVYRNPRLPRSGEPVAQGVFPRCRRTAGRQLASTAKWLEALVGHVLREKISGMVDLGGGDTALHRLASTIPDLLTAIDAGGVSPVAVYTLSSRTVGGSFDTPRMPRGSVGLQLPNRVAPRVDRVDWCGTRCQAGNRPPPARCSLWPRQDRLARAITRQRGVTRRGS